MTEKSYRKGLVAVVTIVVVAAAIYWFVSSDSVKSPTAPAVVEESVVTPSTEVDRAPSEVSPENSEPIHSELVVEPPALNDSDEAVRGDLMSLSADGALARWLVSKEVIRKWVAAVSTAARGDLVHKNRPFTNLSGTIKTEVLSVDGDGVKVYQLSADNFQRYDQPVRLMALVDSDRAIQLYQFWYPRLAEAYGELGTRDKTFHQVVLQAIDQALTAPELKQPIKLMRPSVYYKFADKKLEKMPGIYKLMIRIGPDNAARVKEKLRELKQRLEKIQPQ